MVLRSSRVASWEVLGSRPESRGAKQSWEKPSRAVSLRVAIACLKGMKQRKMSGYHLKWIWLLPEEGQSPKMNMAKNFKKYIWCGIEFILWLDLVGFAEMVIIPHASEQGTYGYGRCWLPYHGVLWVIARVWWPGNIWVHGVSSRGVHWRFTWKRCARKCRVEYICKI